MEKDNGLHHVMCHVCEENRFNEYKYMEGQTSLEYNANNYQFIHIIMKGYELNLPHMLRLKYLCVNSL